MAPRKGEVRRAEILAAARAVLVDEGLGRFVLRDIAVRVGLVLGNLQYYYPTRDDLLEAVVRAEFARNQAEVAAIAAGRGTATARLAAVARRLIDVWARSGGRVYAAMSLLALHQPRFRALHREVYLAFYESLLPVLREIRPGARRAELLAVARLVTTLVDGALVQVPGRGFAADAVAAAVRLACAGARPRSPGSVAPEEPRIAPRPRRAARAGA
ncbi:MAG: TetR family transcriptional regulator [Deltaproteobacteria bacterium]|nr:TetR family transcriptional regulator [Deltaproteobacteria bacterium]